MHSNSNTFGLSYKISNQSSDVMVIKMKGGLSYLVRKSKEPTFQVSRTILITISDVFLTDLLIEPNKALSLLDKKILTELRKEQDRLMVRSEIFYKQLPSNLMISVALSDDLIETDDALHSELLGFTLYLGEDALLKEALNTPQHTIQQINNRMGDKKLLQTSIHVNDPKKVFQTLYTNVLGIGREIPVTQSLDKTPGLYINYSNNNLPDNQFYNFEELTTNKLEQLGIFNSKSDCDKTSNTERTLLAENKTKDLIKATDGLRTKLKLTEEVLLKTEQVVNKLTTESTQIKHEHKLEVANLKINISSLKTAIEQMKSENKFKDIVNKKELESNNWSDVAKSFATIAGVCFTGYQLFSKWHGVNNAKKTRHGNRRLNA